MEQQLITCLKTHYAIDAMDISPLSLGADRDASIFKATTHNNDTYFVKLKSPNAHGVGVAIIDFLKSKGIQHIIPPIQTVNSSSTMRVHDCVMSIFPFIPGEDGFTRPLDDDQWEIFGRELRSIHALDIPKTLQSQMRRESYSPKWRDVVRSFYPLIEGDLVGDDAQILLLTCMKKNKESIEKIVNRAESLAQEVMAQFHDFVLCHGDLHGGNVMIDDKNNLYIIDWDDPVMAPRERDLMFIGAGICNVWNQPSEIDLFYKGYGDIPINKALLAYYRYERIVEDIADYGQQILLSQKGGDKRMEWCHAFMTQFDENNVVPIAFKTDEDYLVSSR